MKNEGASLLFVNKKKQKNFNTFGAPFAISSTLRALAKQPSLPPWSFLSIKVFLLLFVHKKKTSLAFTLA